MLALLTEAVQDVAGAWRRARADDEPSSWDALAVAGHRLALLADRVAATAGARAEAVRAAREGVGHVPPSPSPPVVRVHSGALAQGGRRRTGDRISA